MKTFIALLAGLVFGAGIVVAGLFDPHVIVGALNIFGSWDPTLHIALTAAAGTYAGIRWLTRRREAPLAAARFHEPTNRQIDRKLVIGASLFGASWGFAGCGPGLAMGNLGAGGAQAVPYLLSLAVGIAVAEPAYQWLRAPRQLRYQ